MIAAVAITSLFRLAGKVGDLATKEGPSGAFFKGVLTTVLATPCSGPLLGSALTWANAFAQELVRLGFGGWLMPGIAAAAYLDLGLHPKSGPGLFQWMSAPGLLAHATEMANKPLTALPFIDDSRYFIDDD